MPRDSQGWSDSLIQASTWGPLRGQTRLTPEDLSLCPHQHALVSTGSVWAVLVVTLGGAGLQWVQGRVAALCLTMWDSPTGEPAPQCQRCWAAKPATLTFAHRHPGRRLRQFGPGQAVGTVVTGQGVLTLGGGQLGVLAGGRGMERTRATPATGPCLANPHGVSAKTQDGPALFQTLKLKMCCLLTNSQT